MTEGFSLQIENQPSQTYITCRGVLDVLPAEKLRDAIRSATEREAGMVVLDCTGVTLVTSAGITALVDAAVEVRETGKVLQLRFSPHVRRILDLVGLWWLGVIDDGVAVYESLQKALRRFADHSYDRSFPDRDGGLPSIEKEGQ